MQETALRISVVIPAYNAAGSIARAIKSCYVQSLLPAEIIVVDDGSSDATVTLVQQSFPEVRLIVQAKNGGPSLARNTGWDKAQGDIVAFLDSDDSWHPQKLELVAGLFRKYPEVDCIAHPFALQLKEQHYDQLPALQSLGWFSLLLHSKVQTSCLCVRRSLALRFDNSYRYCEDHELTVRIARGTGCYFTDLPLTVLGRPQLSPGGASAQLWKMRKGQLRIYSSIVRYNALYALLLPFLWSFSLLKFLLQWLRLRLQG
jgi:glycosyltransferase involved in cell wall biosynthesis